MNENMLGFLFISGLIASLLSFYDAFRVQMYRGIASKSKTESIFKYVFLIVQTQLSAYSFFGENVMFPLIIIILFSLFLVIYRIHVNGRVIVIKDTSKKILIDQVRCELTRLSLPFTEESSNFSDVYQFHLEDQVIIKISSPWGGEKEFKTFHLNFIKWWRFPQYDEFKTSVIETYREEREEIIFWKPILTSISQGIAILLFLSFIAWKWNPFV